MSELQYREPYEDLPDHDRIESAVASSSAASQIYVTTGRAKMYVGTGGKHFTWRKVHSPPPGRLAASVGKHDVLYAEWNALFRSYDGGRSWERLTCGLLIHDVAISPSDPRTIYLATGQPEAYDGDEDGGGIYVTTDGGRTWKRSTRFVKEYVDQRGVEVVAVIPDSPQQVYAGREFGGIEFSRDGARHWKFASVARPGNGTDGPQMTVLAFGAGSTLWAGSRFRGVFAADVRGQRWRFRGFQGQWINQVLPSRRTRGLVYVATSRDRDPVFRSRDGGAHWDHVDGLPPVVFGLTLQRSDDTLYAWSRTRIFRSRDDGATWTALPPLPR
jgi:photosystem II stability/assembly factor-like uncharacterized protein